MDYVQAHGRVTTRDMVREHKASPNTAKATFANLVKKGLLVRHGAGRSIWYGLSVNLTDVLLGLKMRILEPRIN